MAWPPAAAMTPGSGSFCTREGGRSCVLVLGFSEVTAVAAPPSPCPRPLCPAQPLGHQSSREVLAWAVDVDPCFWESPVHVGQPPLARPCPRLLSLRTKLALSCLTPLLHVALRHRRTPRFTLGKCAWRGGGAHLRSEGTTGGQAWSPEASPPSPGRPWRLGPGGLVAGTRASLLCVPERGL